MHNAAVATVLILCLAGSAAAQAAGGADLCTGLVDPYNPVDQRTRFHQAAGFDGEMTLAEFNTNLGRPNAFVCKADNWQFLRIFDRNRNGTISWFEADAYRKAFRERVMSVFDADGDGQLLGAEREAANRSLASGRISAEAGRPPRTQPARVLDADAQRRRKELLARYDTDRDGRISPQERRAMYQAQTRQRRRKYIETHDTDGDGKLSPAETKAARAADQKLMDQRGRRQEEKRFDADRDGKLSQTEAKALAEWRRKMEQDRKARMDRYDGDGDGVLSEYERKVMYDDLRRRGADPSGDPDDGEDAIDDEELLGPEPEDTEGTFRQRMLRKYDLDGDGVLNADERKEMWHDQFLKGLGAEPSPPKRR